MSSASVSRRDVPDATVARLTVYLRTLRTLHAAGTLVVSSEELAEAAGVRPTGLRKDLSLLGSYGVRGVGYDVPRLADEISRVLGTQRELPVVIVGMGNLGRALAQYRGFDSRGFAVRWLVDSDPALTGTRLGALTVTDYAGLPDVTDEPVIGVVATPADGAQGAVDSLVARGVRSILNFAPQHVEAPEGVEVRQVDIATELQILAFHEHRSRAADEVVS